MLFLDEPSRSPDLIAAHKARETVEQVRQEGTTMLLTTHLLEEADQVCQQVAINRRRSLYRSCGRSSG